MTESYTPYNRKQKERSVPFIRGWMLIYAASWREIRGTAAAKLIADSGAVPCKYKNVFDPINIASIHTREGHIHTCQCVTT